MEYRILGPLEVCDGERSLALGGAKQRALLAVLLLHRGEVVSSDGLIDALWGERPPPTAAKSVQVYVSHLRKALGEGRLITRGGGYALAVAAGELDVERFEGLAADGRRLLASDDAKGAAETLRRALAVWRGRALQDFAYDDFAATEIPRLEELRLGVIEERIDADLALGRQAEAVAELEALVREHPLRERLRGQLMLALYRSGRQADALGRYQEGRRALVEGLGLEPGRELRELEQAILRQDPALGPAGRGPRRVLRNVPRGRWLAGIGVALLVAAAGTALVIHGGTSKAEPLLAPDTLGAIDPMARQLVGVPVAGAPDRLATLGGVVWAVADDSRTISKIDPRRHVVTRLFNPGGAPRDIAAGLRYVWVIDERTRKLVKIDPDYGVVGRFALPKPPVPPSLTRYRSFDPWSVAAGAGAMWITDGSSWLSRVDPRTGRRRQFNMHHPLDGVTVASGALWAISGRGAAVLRILPGRSKKPVRIPIVDQPGYASPYPIAIEAGLGSIWVLNGNTATVTRIDPRQRGIVGTIPIGIEHLPVRLAVGTGSVWVAGADGTLSRIDPGTNSVATTRTVAHGLNDVVVSGRIVWVSAARGSGGRAVAAAPTRGRPSVRALPTAACSPLYYRPGDRPRLLIASDFTMQGRVGFEGAQITEAIRFVLARHGFRAGRYPIAYQACDVSTPTPDVDYLAKCKPNAQAYAGDPNVVGVIGSFASDCTRLEVPILNRAHGGPIATVNATSTYSALTRAAPGSARNEPSRYAPTGRRSFVRLIPPDDVQAAADAMLGRQLGVTRVYDLNDGSGYGRGIAAAFRQASRRLGIRVVGSAVFGFSGEIIRHVKESGADGVFLGGNSLPYGSHLVRALRRALPAGTELLASDGWATGEFLPRAGRAAEGLTVSVAGTPIDRLPGRGARFVREFGSAIGERPIPYSVYAAQATELLLDGIARSDGTRSSALRQLFTERVRNGILGTFAITPEGDTTERTVTIYRVHRGALRFWEVIKPRASLIDG